MTDLSVIIPARNEEFLQQTIDDVLKHAEADTEVIAFLDGYWPDPGIRSHPKVVLVHHEESIGQRASVNLGAEISRARFVMKLDAHCAVDQGFDVKLMETCEPDWTVIPKMYNLHAFDWRCLACGNRTYQGPMPTVCEKCKSGKGFEKVMVWKPRLNRGTEFWRFDKNMKFQYWRAYKKRDAARGDICDVMSSIGASFFMHRERFFELGGMDEAHGSWGQFGTEVACKAWLSGGRHVVNKTTWFAHMFRTNSKGFSFPYRLRGKDVQRAREHSKKLWLGNAWPKAKHKIDYIVEKFRPVPDWHDNELTKALVYYTDNTGDPFFMETCRKQLMRCMNEYHYPIISVSQKPMDFGQNIVLDIGRSVLSIFRQILAGLEASDADVVFLIEHDLIYHPAHFDFSPEKENVFYYDRNRWSVCDETGKAVFYHTDVPSMVCAYRSLLVRHYKRCVEFVTENGWKGRYGYSPPKGLPKEMRYGKAKSYFSDFPCLDVRREASWSRKRMDKSQFRSEKSRRGWKEADEVPGWGRIRGRFGEFVREVNERGPQK